MFKYLPTCYTKLTKNCLYCRNKTIFSQRGYTLRCKYPLRKKKDFARMDAIYCPWLVDPQNTIIFVKYEIFKVFF